MPLTDQRMLFVEEYIRLHCKNARQAAINAGYSEKSAQSQSSQILNDPKVLEYLKERKEQLKSDLQQEFIFDALDAKKVMFEIMKNGNKKDTDRINVAKDFLDRAGFKPQDKTELSGDVGLNIVVDYGDVDESG